MRFPKNSIWDKHSSEKGQYDKRVAWFTTIHFDLKDLCVKRGQRFEESMGAEEVYPLAHEAVSNANLVLHNDDSSKSLEIACDQRSCNAWLHRHQARQKTGAQYTFLLTHSVKHLGYQRHMA
jgi:hypothetical protein